MGTCLTAMRMHVRARHRVTGSALNDSVAASMVGAEATLEIDSPDWPAHVAKVVRNAERGCFVMPVLLKPVLAAEQTVLNDLPLVME
jgi:ketopantoate hydroxymethyltransferase